MNRINQSSKISSCQQHFLAIFPSFNLCYLNCQKLLVLSNDLNFYFLLIFLKIQILLTIEWVILSFIMAVWIYCNLNFDLKNSWMKRFCCFHQIVGFLIFHSWFHQILILMLDIFHMVWSSFIFCSKLALLQSSKVAGPCQKIFLSSNSLKYYEMHQFHEVLPCFCLLHLKKSKNAPNNYLRLFLS